MANRKITQFPAFDGVDIQPNDLLTLVHVFEVDPSLKNKKITFTEFRNYLNQFYVTSTGVQGDVTIKGNLTVTGDVSAAGGEFNNLRIIDDNDVLVANISGDDNGSASFASGAVTIADNGNTFTDGTLGCSGIFTIASGVNANGSIGTSGYFLKSRGPGQPAVWDSIDTKEVTLTGDVRVSGTLTVTGNTTVSGLLTTSGLLVTGSTAIFQSGISVTGDSSVSGLLTVSGITVTGDAVFQSGISVTGNSSISGDLNVSGGTNVSGLLTTSGLTVTGNGQFHNISVVDDNDVLVARISGDDNGSASFPGCSHYCK